MPEYAKIVFYPRWTRTPKYATAEEKRAAKRECDRKAQAKFQKKLRDQSRMYEELRDTLLKMKK